MNILLIVNYPGDLEGVGKGRFRYLVDMLVGRNHQVEMVISDFLHGEKEFRPIHSISEHQFKITILHESGYKSNVSLRRLYSQYVWGKNVGRYLEQLDKTPNVIYCAVPTLTANREAAKFCKRHNIKYIVDIQDIWPEAFRLLLPKCLRWVLKPIEKYVDNFYKQADVVVAVSDTYKARGLMTTPKERIGLTVYLGNDVALFDASRVKYSIERDDNSLWLAYIGTLGFSYDIPCVMNALKIYEERYPQGIPYKFVLMGNGPFREKWEKLAIQMGVDCLFTGILSYDEMVGKLCSCDIAINPIRKGAALSITNKVGDYAHGGLPVINTMENEEYRNLIEKYQCGINCKCGDAEDVADALFHLSRDSDLRKIMGNNFRKLGLERFDR